MFWQKSYLTLGLLGVFLLSVTADSSVHIGLAYQMLTSSTLNWLPPSHYSPTKNTIVYGGFVTVRELQENLHNNQSERWHLKNEPLFVCRAFHEGLWVVGSQRYNGNRCTVTIHGNVHSYEKYDLLENVENAARVNWVRWEKFIEGPVVAVESGSMYIGRHEVGMMEEENESSAANRHTHYIGTVTANDNFGSLTYVNNEGREVSAKSGEILIETEPKHYELTGVKVNWPKKRVIRRVQEILGEDTITNTGKKAATMAKGFGFSYSYLMYWGQGHAMLYGLNTSITLANGTSLPNIMWSVKLEDNDRQDVYTVEVFLEPGTGVNVTLKANDTDVEVPYTGKLISHYGDTITKARDISGFRRERAMFDIIPEFGPIYFLSNYSLVPTTTPEPTTLPTTTTTLPYDSSKDVNPPEMDSTDHDENLIIAPKRSDTSNMQSDDGGPLSLKNKVETPHSGTCLFKSDIIIIPVLIILHRIT